MMLTVSGSSTSCRSGTSARRGLVVQDRVAVEEGAAPGVLADQAQLETSRSRVA
jgi:hypothetical protein